LIEFPGESIRCPAAAIASITLEEGKKTYSVSCPRCKTEIEPTMGEWFHRECGTRMKFSPLREFTPEKAPAPIPTAISSRPPKKRMPLASGDW
jgi:hypothetical protein